MSIMQIIFYTVFVFFVGVLGTFYWSYLLRMKFKRYISMNDNETFPSFFRDLKSEIFSPRLTKTQIIEKINSGSCNKEG